MKRRALFVGVNDYKDPAIRNLCCSCRDANSLHDFFEMLGFQTRLLENPSKVDVFNAVHEMIAGKGPEDALRPGDQFLLYFAGHGFTDAGQHLLFCADDMYRQLRYHRAGIPFDQLEEETRGGYDRAFLLDACRSDFLTGARGADETTRNLLAIGEMVPREAEAPGGFYVLRSCSKFEHALEVASRQHGLFTLGLLEVLRSRREAGDGATLDDTLREAVERQMGDIATDVGMTLRQTPESSGRGPTQTLFGKRGPSGPELAHVECPVCGKYNLITDTFHCKVCGRDHLCLAHRSAEHNSCTDCAQTAQTKQKRREEAESLYQKGEDFYYGRNGVKQDFTEAVKWYRQAAEQGHAGAQFNLALMYENGRGVPQSDAEAVKWYRQAAEQGHAPAQSNLGVMYADGRGVPQSDAEGVKWYRQAAEQGNAPAQFNLGLMYDKGRGVPQSDAEAVKWYRQAAEQGHAPAQSILCFMYANGRGVSKDLRKYCDCDLPF